MNDGDVLHDITIPALASRMAALPGAKVSTSLTVAEPGRYEFFCSVPGHRDAGMQGFLAVG